MKFAVLLATLTMAATFNMAYAEDANSNDSEALAYCNDQLEMEGIEDEAEKAEFLRECIAGVTSSENQ